MKERPCAVLADDMRLHVEAADAVGYPDVLALCEEPRFYDERRDVLLNPTLLVAVLSPSTEACDRGGRFAVYRRVESLREYVLIAQDRPSVEVFTRQADRRWLLSTYGEVDEVAELASVQCRLALADVYHGVRFDTPPPRETGTPTAAR